MPASLPESNRVRVAVLSRARGRRDSDGLDPVARPLPRPGRHDRVALSPRHFVTTSPRVRENRAAQWPSFTRARRGCSRVCKKSHPVREASNPRVIASGSTDS